MKNELTIKTHLGPVAVTTTGGNGNKPVLYLHGVFLNKTLWDRITPHFEGYDAIYVDMPGHGSSGQAEIDWSLADCVEMVKEIISGLGHEKVIAVGHSWGSMVLLRAAVKYPGMFSALGLMNMPFEPPGMREKITMEFVKKMAGFKRLFGRVAANSLYSRGYLKMHPEAVTNIQQNLLRRSTKEIQQIVDAVLIHADDGRPYLDQLGVPALAAIGVDDRVGKPGNLETHVLPGAHVSPCEAPLETIRFIGEVLKLSGAGD